MTEKTQISMRIDPDLIEKVDKMRDGVDRSLVMTRLLESWVQGKVKIELFR
jgi:metal-responsive CopG/Arc/MetJ family transcriptional regulator